MLLFCPTKDRCEKCCSLLVQALRREAVRAAGGRSASEQARLAGGRADTLRALQRTAVGVCDQLLGCVVAGVAFHHAGLVSDERTVIEDAFRRSLHFTSFTLLRSVHFTSLHFLTSLQGLHLGAVRDVYA